MRIEDLNDDAKDVLRLMVLRCEIFRGKHLLGVNASDLQMTKRFEGQSREYLWFMQRSLQEAGLVERCRRKPYAYIPTPAGREWVEANPAAVEN